MLKLNAQIDNIALRLGCGWDVFRLAIACKFFGGLTNVHRLATA